MSLCGDHHYVADFVDLFESDTHWYLIMEMASGGELFDRLITRGKYTETHASVLIREVAEALAYIHQQVCITSSSLNAIVTLSNISRLYQKGGCTFRLKT